LVAQVEQVTEHDPQFVVPENVIPQVFEVQLFAAVTEQSVSG